MIVALPKDNTLCFWPTHFGKMTKTLAVVTLSFLCCLGRWRKKAKLHPIGSKGICPKPPTPRGFATPYGVQKVGTFDT